MMKAFVALVACGAAVQIDHLKSRNPEDVWIAFSTRPDHVQFFNPAKEKIADQVPAGGRRASKNVALLATSANLTRAGPWDGDCSPKCTWECKKVECEKECKPKCGLPKCQTRCRDPDMSQCQIKCDDEPHCATFCPPQEVCEKAANGTRVCHKPDCATKCEKPQCHMFCGNNGAQVCENVCAEPKCDWECHDPESCPKPECCLKCHQPNCQQRVTNFAMPDLKPGERVVNEYQAHAPEKWAVGPWSACDCKSGKQYRQVKCGGKLDTCGLGETPPTAKRCDIPCKGHFEFSHWSECKGECFTEGYQYREGQCVMGNCDGRPTSRELRRCKYDAERCHTCRVTLYGGSCLDGGETPCEDGWSAEFGMGVYEEREMRQHDARPLDTSSLKVEGYCCAARLFQYSNRNRGTNPGSAWEVTFAEGIYGKRALEQRGAFNDEDSSLEVFKDQHCIDAVRNLHLSAKSGAAAAAATAALVLAAVLA